jgi:glycosyltransferase involved in cell wall biosynthesis
VIALRRSDAACADLGLVLAGADRGMLTALLEQSRASEGSLIYIGTPSDDELTQWYRRAAVFAYPSRYEGFGLPPLEAMACGTPVLASTAGSVPEVVGAAGRLLDVDDAKGWCDAIRAVITNGEHAGELGAGGPPHAARFTWERTARATVDTYARAVAQRGEP